MGEVQARTAAGLPNLLVRGRGVFGQDQGSGWHYLRDDAQRPYRCNMGAHRPMKLRRYDTARRNHALNCVTICATGLWAPRAPPAFSNAG